MRKSVTIILIALMGLAVLPAAPARAQAVQVVVDGQLVVFDQPPVIVGGRVLVPLRGVFERLGAVVEWDPRTNVVMATRGTTQVRLQIGSRQAYVNGSLLLLDVPAVIVGGRTLVPLRFVSEAMGARVDWNPAQQAVFITSGQGAQPAPPVSPVPAPLPPPPTTTAAVVEGTVFRVDLTTSPQRLFVQRDNTIYTFVVTPDTAITRVDVGTNQGGAVSLDQIRPGDVVRVTADAQGRAILVRVQVREVAGRVDILAGQVIVLTDGRTFSLADNVRFTVDGRDVARDQVRPGMDVTLRLNPQTNQVLEVAARGVVQVPPPPTGAVRIASFSHNAQKPLREGEVLTVTLRGTAGGQATFDIFGVAADIPMREISPGVYQGAYTVRRGDNVASAAIFGHLRVGGVDAPLVQSGTPVTIDTLPPVIRQRVPEPNATINNARPNIVITFEDQGGAGIEAAATRLVINGQDVTARATVTDTVVAYNPPDPLSGRVTVQLLLRDRAGNQVQDAWAFTIGVVQGALIRSVTINPTTPLQAGQTLTLTMVGEPGGQAAFTIEGVAENIPLVEATNQPGTYFGSYMVRPGDNVANARIFVRLTKSGVTTQAETSTRVTILGAQGPTPTILSPQAGERVGSPIVIKGTAAPGDRIVVRVDYAGTLFLFALRGTYGEVQTTADAQGQWQVSINASIRIPNAELTITVVAIDPAGRRSTPATVVVIQS